MRRVFAIGIHETVKGGRRELRKIRSYKRRVQTSGEFCRDWPSLGKMPLQYRLESVSEMLRGFVKRPLVFIEGIGFVRQ
jgi:hypothetical protein